MYGMSRQKPRKFCNTKNPLCNNKLVFQKNILWFLTILVNYPQELQNLKHVIAENWESIVSFRLFDYAANGNNFAST